eukprot:284147-Alexandrium_andersonii.AAC.1
MPGRGLLGTAILAQRRAVQAGGGLLGTAILAQRRAVGTAILAQRRAVQASPRGGRAVSYTHLTLPTICSV